MENIIQINNLNFGYQKNNQILKNININVPRGSIYGFIGPNGAGKSTTMRLISGIETTNQEVLIFNQPIKSQIPNIFHKIGALVESPTLYYHLSGEDNLKYIAITRGLSFEKIDKVLDLVDLLDAKKTKVKRYSLGMKQRLAIAMSIIHEPELLLLDEPVNGLDPTGIIEIRELLIKINQEKNTTIFISSHLLSEIEKMCTHIGIIAKGEIKFEGTIQELSNKFKSYQIEIQTDITEKIIQKLTDNHFDFEEKESSLIFSVNDKNEIPELIRKLILLDVSIYEVKKIGGLRRMVFTNYKLIILKMKKFISTLTIAIKGELIKKKRSSIYLLAIILGALIPITYFLVSYFIEQDKKPILSYNFYENVIQKTVNPFAYFTLVILIIINASKIAQIDHKNNGWQLMDVLPIKRSSTFIAKFIIINTANLISIITFFVSTILCSFVLSKTLPFPEGTTTFIPITFILISIVKLIVSSLFLSTLQYIFSVHFSNYIWAILIGFFSYLATNLFKAFNIEYDWNPFTILSKSASHISDLQLDTYFIFYEKLSIILSILAFSFGLIWFKFKTFKLAFLNSIQSKLATIFCILVSFLGIYFYLKPNRFEPYKKTIISGKIDSEIPINSVYIFDNSAQDTLAEIKVTNNTFHHEFKEDIVLNEYKIKFGSYQEIQNFVFSKNDSTFFNFRMTNKGFDIKVKGTRLAENNYEDGKSPFSYAKYKIENSLEMENFNEIQKELYDDYENEIKKIRNFKTLNNYTYKNDFENFIKKRIIVGYLDYFEKLKEQTKSLFPKVVQNDLPEWKILSSKINYFDQELLNEENYMKLITRNLIKNDTIDEDKNLKLIKNISKLKDSNFKEKLLFSNLITALVDSKSNKERETYQEFIKHIKTEKHQNFLNYKFKMLQKIGKGNLAFNIIGLDADGKTHTLAELKGKFVVLDFWATWCGPCLYETPFFDKMALNYKNDNVVFLSISMDENKQKWLAKVRNNHSKVIHWIASNTSEMAENYQIYGIPRFVVIDKEGKFFEAQMARPSEKSFETILNMTLGKKAD